LALLFSISLGVGTEKLLISACHFEIIFLSKEGDIPGNTGTKYSVKDPQVYENWQAFFSKSIQYCF
jgi:hypothetical protein